MDIIKTVHKATCLRQSLGACVAPAWKAAINTDIDRIGAIVWFSSPSENWGKPPTPENLAKRRA